MAVFSCLFLDDDLKRDREEIVTMGVSFKYWDECIEAEDLMEMWEEDDVSTEWLDAGEERGQKVHLSRDPDGQPFLTQTEMRAVVNIVVQRHFNGEVDPDMICAIAELESDRQLLAVRCNKKTKETTVGMMQITPKNAAWLFSEMGYRVYDVEQNPDLLFRPFISVYFGAAYLIWLSTFQDKDRTEEFVIRAYRGGTKKATHKSTLPYWKNYLSVKEALPQRKFLEDGPLPGNVPAPPAPTWENTGAKAEYWDDKASPEDMEQMWNHHEIAKEWTKSGEKQGRVRFSHDSKKRSYLSRAELKAVAEIILSKYFSSKGVKAAYLCALAEMVSMRFLHGVAPRIGLMGIDYSTAYWIYTELGYRAYKVESAKDLTKPFVSMYFGAAYLCYLSEFERQERTPQFVVQAYLEGPKNVNLEETSPSWLKFEQALSNYEVPKAKIQGTCTIL